VSASSKSGRQQRQRWGPREIDVDILLTGIAWSRTIADGAAPTYVERFLFVLAPPQTSGPTCLA